MDRFQLFYATLDLKFPDGYRHSKGLKYIIKLQRRSDADLWKEYHRLGGK